MTRFPRLNTPSSPAVRLLALCALAAAGLLVTGCPSTGVVCSPGLTACGTGCADVASDRSNCGGCGASCQQAQVCVSATCQCQPGSTSCSGVCAILQTDPLNCGACGQACLSGQVCEQGKCKASCTFGSSSLCGQSCVDLSTDPNNCGFCGNPCNSGLSCRNAHCSYDLVAACFDVGEVVGFQSGPDIRGPLAPFGVNPGALASVAGTVLLSADQKNPQLIQGRLSDFAVLPEAPTVGTPGNACESAVLASDPWVYVINSCDNTLQILQRNLDGGVRFADGGANPPPGQDWPLDAGLGLATIGEVQFGASTSPEFMVKVSSNLYVTLWGGFYPDIDAGQRVARVDVSNPAAPAVVSTYDLSGLPLHPFDGGVAIARPTGIIAQNGFLYVAMNNQDPNYAVAGPGLLAKIALSSGSVSEVPLGPGCLSPQGFVSDGAHLFVVCIGAEQLNSSFVAVANQGAGMVMLDTPSDGGPEAVLSTWTIACPPGGPDGGCMTPVPMNVARVNNRIYVGDSNGGRIFAADVVGLQLVERRGYASADAGPIQACPFQSGIPVSNVFDLLVP